jgi:hypothetical protein
MALLGERFAAAIVSPQGGGRGAETRGDRMHRGWGLGEARSRAARFSLPGPSAGSQPLHPPPGLPPPGPHLVRHGQGGAAARLVMREHSVARKADGQVVPQRARLAEKLQVAAVDDVIALGSVGCARVCFLGGGVQAGSLGFCAEGEAGGG